MIQDPHQTNEEDDDWRLHAVARLAKSWTSPWSGQIAPPGTRLTVSSIIKLNAKKTLVIPLPNASAIFLSASAKAYKEAKKIRDLSEIDTSLLHQVSFKSDAQSFDYIEQMMQSIVLAFTALEAFVNEAIPDDYQYRKLDALEPINKEKIERFLTIDEKLDSVLPEVLKCRSPKSSRFWSDYKDLKKCRERIVHMKTKDRKSSGPDVNTVWKAMFVTLAPHLTVLSIITYFSKHLEKPPKWLEKFPDEYR